MRTIGELHRQAAFGLGGGKISAQPVHDHAVLVTPAPGDVIMRPNGLVQRPIDQVPAKRSVTEQEPQETRLGPTVGSHGWSGQGIGERRHLRQPVGGFPQVAPLEPEDEQAGCHRWP